MIVISDTSVISNLYLTGQLQLLPKLFHLLLIPPKVMDELKALQQFNIDVQPILQAEFIVLQVPTNHDFIRKLLKILDQGEAESIALAVEVQANLLLIDELKGRAVAEQHGLNVTGLLGVLIRAKKAGHIQVVRPIIDDLRKNTGFFIGDSLYAQILQLAGE